MVAGCGPKFAKLLLFVLNFAVWLTGIVLIGGGSYMTAKQNEYTDLFSEDSILIVSGTIIGLGCFSFIVGFCGCCGALKESMCLLRMYFLFMLIIIVVEAVAGILAFIFSDDVERSMMDGMTDTIRKSYGSDKRKGANKAIDDIQREFSCCGARNYSDYGDTAHFKDHSVPESCCKMNTTFCQMGIPGLPLYPDLVYSDGCVDAAVDWIKSHYWVVGGVCLALLVFEIMAMAFACCVMSGIKAGDYDKFA